MEQLKEDEMGKLEEMINIINQISESRKNEDNGDNCSNSEQRMEESERYEDILSKMLDCVNQKNHSETNSSNENLEIENELKKIKENILTGSGSEKKIKEIIEDIDQFVFSRRKSKKNIQDKRKNIFVFKYRGDKSDDSSGEKCENLNEFTSNILKCDELISPPINDMKNASISLEPKESVEDFNAIIEINENSSKQEDVLRVLMETEYVSKNEKSYPQNDSAENFESNQTESTDSDKFDLNVVVEKVQIEEEQSIAQISLKKDALATTKYNNELSYIEHEVLTNGKDTSPVLDIKKQDENASLSTSQTEMENDLEVCDKNINEKISESELSIVHTFNKTEKYNAANSKEDCVSMSATSDTSSQEIGMTENLCPVMPCIVKDTEKSMLQSYSSVISPSILEEYSLKNDDLKFSSEHADDVCQQSECVFEENIDQNVSLPIPPESSIVDECTIEEKDSYDSQISTDNVSVRVQESVLEENINKDLPDVSSTISLTVDECTVKESNLKSSAKEANDVFSLSNEIVKEKDDFEVLSTISNDVPLAVNEFAGKENSNTVVPFVIGSQNEGSISEESVHLNADVSTDIVSNFDKECINDTNMLDVSTPFKEAIKENNDKRVNIDTTDHSNSKNEFCFEDDPLANIMKTTNLGSDEDFLPLKKAREMEKINNNFNEIYSSKRDSNQENTKYSMPPIPPLRKKRSPSLPALNFCNGSEIKLMETTFNKSLYDDIVPPPETKVSRRALVLKSPENIINNPFLNGVISNSSYSMSDLSAIDYDDIDFRQDTNDNSSQDETNSECSDSVIEKPVLLHDVKFSSPEISECVVEAGSQYLLHRASVSLVESPFATEREYKKITPVKTPYLRKKSFTFTKGDTYMQEVRSNIKVKKKTNSVSSLIRRTFSLKDVSKSDNPPCLPNLFKRYKRKKKEAKQCHSNNLATITEEDPTTSKLTSSESFASIFLHDDDDDDDDDDDSYLERCIGNFDANLSYKSLHFPDPPDVVRRSSSSIDVSQHVNISFPKPIKPQRLKRSMSCIQRGPYQKHLFKSLMTDDSSISLNPDALKKAQELLHKSLGLREDEHGNVLPIRPKRTRSRLSLNSLGDASLNDLYDYARDSKESPIPDVDASAENFGSIFLSNNGDDNELQEHHNSDDILHSVFHDEHHLKCDKNKEINTGDENFGKGCTSDDLNKIAIDHQNFVKQRILHLKQESEALMNISHKIHDIHDAGIEHHEEIMRSFLRRYSSDIQSIMEDPKDNEKKWKEMSGLYQAHLERSLNEINKIGSKEILGTDSVNNSIFNVTPVDSKLSNLSLSKDSNNKNVSSIEKESNELDYSEEHLENLDSSSDAIAFDENLNNGQYQVFNFPFNKGISEGSKNFTVDSKTLIKECMDGTLNLKLQKLAKVYEGEVIDKQNSTENDVVSDENDKTEETSIELEEEVIQHSDESTSSVQQYLKDVEDSEIPEKVNECQTHVQHCPATSTHASSTKDENLLKSLDLEELTKQYTEEILSHMLKLSQEYNNSGVQVIPQIEEKLKNVKKFSYLNMKTNSLGLIENTTSTKISEGKTSKLDNSNDPSKLLNQKYESIEELANQYERELMNYYNELFLKESPSEQERKDSGPFEATSIAESKSQDGAISSTVNNPNKSNLDDPESVQSAATEKLANQYTKEIVAHVMKLSQELITSEITKVIPHIEKRLKNVFKSSYLNMETNSLGLIKSVSEDTLVPNEKIYNFSKPESTIKKKPFVRPPLVKSVSFNCPIEYIGVSSYASDQECISPLSSASSNSENSTQDFDESDRESFPTFQPLTLTKISANIYFHDKKSDMFSNQMETSESVNKFFTPDMSTDSTDSVSQYITLNSKEELDCPSRPSIQHLQLGSRKSSITYETLSLDLIPSPAEIFKKEYEKIKLNHVASSPIKPIRSPHLSKRKNIYHFPYLSKSEESQTERRESEEGKRKEENSLEIKYEETKMKEINLEKGKMKESKIAHSEFKDNYIQVPEDKSVPKVVQSPLTNRKFIISSVFDTSLCSPISDLLESEEETSSNSSFEIVSEECLTPNTSTPSIQTSLVISTELLDSVISTEPVDSVTSKELPTPSTISSTQIELTPPPKESPELTVKCTLNDTPQNTPIRRTSDTNFIKDNCSINCQCEKHSTWDSESVKILAVQTKPVSSPEIVVQTWSQRQDKPEEFLTPSPVMIPKWVKKGNKETDSPSNLCKDTCSPGPPSESPAKEFPPTSSPSSVSPVPEGTALLKKEEDRTQKDRSIDVYPETLRQRQRTMAPSPSKVDIKNWEPSSVSNEEGKKFLPSVKALRNQFENGKTHNSLVRSSSNSSSTNSLVMSSLDASSGFGSMTSSQVTLDPTSPVPTAREVEEEPVEPIFSQFKGVDQELKEMMSKPPSTQGWNPHSLLKRLYFVPDAPKMHRREAPFENIEGYLEKLPSGRKKATFWNAWKRRYFVAKDGVLYYYQNNQTERPNMKLPLMGGKIEIMDANMVSIDDGGRESRSAGMLGIDDGKGHYVVVRCSSRQEAERWKAALETHIMDDYSSHYVQPWPRPTNPTLLRDTLVIDIGSCSVRAGVLASQPTLPQLFFPSVVATNRETRNQVWGIEALMPEVRSTSSISFPIRPSHKISKFSVDLNAVSSLLQKTFNDLKVDPQNYNIQLSVPRVLNPHTQAELLKILFDKYGVKAVNLTHQSILALYAYNATSGIVVDVGERLDVVPVIDGYIVDGGVSRVPYGGYRIMDHLRPFLFQRNVSLVNEVDSYVIRQVMESVCYCAQHYNTEKQRCTMDPEKFEKSAPLEQYFPDSPQYEAFKDISLDFGRFQASEGLFNPDAWGLDHPGLHKLVHKAIQECSMDIRKEMSRSVFLVGGVTQMPGLVDRLTVELDNLTPPAIRPKVHASPYRYHAAYIGACVLAESPAFAQSKITKEEWTKQGNSALRKWAL